jgi:toxin YoeB
MLDDGFLDDLAYWIDTGQRVASRLMQLIDAVRRDPFRGSGLPMPRKRAGPNTWSRRLTQEHRVVYRVEHENIVLL